MNHKLSFVFLVVMLSFSGCVKNTPLSLFAGKTTITTEEINGAFAKVFPLQKKSAFGSIVFKRALLIPSRDDSNKVAISVSFALTSFEIPEGIDGVLTLSAGLRYDPKTKKIYLKEVTPVAVQFSNVSLAEYVSKGARSALKVIAMRELSDIEIYQVKESFSARFIKNIVVHKGNIVIDYGF